MSGRDYSRLARLVKPMDSLDFESETGLFQHISARLRQHDSLLYFIHFHVFFVSPNRSRIHTIAKLKALNSGFALPWPAAGDFLVVT